MPTHYPDLNISVTRDTVLALAKREARSATIVILAEDNANGRFFTLMMNEVVGRYMTYRMRFVAEKRSQFPKQNSPDDNFILEADLGHIVLEKCNRAREAINNFFMDRTVGKVVESITKISGRVQRFQQETGQLEPDLDMSWNSYRTLFGLLIIIDFFINLQSFLSVPGIPPIVALFVTIAVALVMVSAGHIHGQVVKQWKDTFGERLEGRGSAYLILGAITAAVLVAFGLVLYARGRMFEALIAREELLNGTAGWTFWAKNILPTIFYNVIVYLTGVVFSYRAHHERKGFDTSFRSYNTRMRRFRSLHRKRLLPNLRRINSEALENTSRTNQRHMTLLGSPVYQKSREILSEVFSKDFDIIEILGQYKSTLDQEIRESNSITRFETEDLTGLSITRRRYISLEEFLAMPIELSFRE